MVLLALDVGTKTIGVAVSDELGIVASGVTTIRRTNLKADLDQLKGVIEDYNPEKVVVGIPYNIDGTVSKTGEMILDFAKALEKKFSIDIEYWDESFSTSNAEEKLIEADLSRKKRKKVIDKMAAVIILQEYLESRNTKDLL